MEYIKPGMHEMRVNAKELKRDEILALARQAKLMIVDGGTYYLNDMATDKELLAFARLLESRHAEADKPCPSASTGVGRVFGDVVDLV